MAEVTIPPHLAHLAERLDIDLGALTADVLYERVLRDPIAALTPRMPEILLVARREAEQLGHHHVGTEHVFLATLLDPYAIPTQIMRGLGCVDDVIDQVRTMLEGAEYNQSRHTPPQSNRSQRPP